MKLNNKISFAKKDPTLLLKKVRRNQIYNIMKNIHNLIVLIIN